MVNIYQTTRRHVPEEGYLELISLLLPVYAVFCLVSVVTGRYCTVGTTSAKSSIHRKCRKRVFAISSLLCARAASCCEDVALKLDYYSKGCFKNDSNNNYCTRGLLSDLSFLPDIDLNLSIFITSFVWKLFCAYIYQECKFVVQYRVYVFWKIFAHFIGYLWMYCRYNSVLFVNCVTDMTVWSFSFLSI